MAEKEYLTERIKYFGDLLKLAFVLLIAIGGGTISLLPGELSSLKTTLAAFGFGSLVFLVILMLILDRKIRALLEDLRKV